MEEKVNAWTARDENGILVVGIQKPIKDDRFGVWLGFGEHMEINTCLLPQVRWKDVEPAKVELTIKISK